MKTFLLLFFLMFSLNCIAQETEQVPVYRVIAIVDRIAGDETTLHNSEGNYYATSIPELIKNKEYVFWVEKHGDNKVSIIRHSMTTGQVQRDQAKISEDLSHRKIL